jgi:deoxycytidylate deaminase
MSKPATILNLQQTTSSKKTSEKSASFIRERRSQELVIALCGAMGSGIKNLQSSLSSGLEQHGYHVEHIILSSLLAKCKSPSENINDLRGYARYEQLQNLGDSLRKELGNSIAAELAIQEITILREARYGDPTKPVDGALKIKEKAAYIVDQVKNPEEIELLREVYKNNFYLIGLLRTEEERRRNLKDEGISETNITALIERDRKASENYGQQVEESLHKSDYFIRNIDAKSEISNSVDRFIKLVHGTNHVTPTKDETGIYAAFSASLRSACLSRQVGAAIADDNGVILSTGCNDVPKYGGGVYDAESVTDKRCFNHQGLCHNDKHKTIFKQEIENVLDKNDIKNAKAIAEEIFKNSKAKYLIEYSRAIHAEMDAIISLARCNNDTIGKTLYCTTYPCHICARHIVASGIKRVVYIEPYEKSLATQLHGDAICHPDNKSDEKVLFENFEGVSPKRYAKFFGFNKQRKDSQGKAISYKVRESGHVDPQYLDSYVEYELKVVDLLRSKIPDIS